MSGRSSNRRGGKGGRGGQNRNNNWRNKTTKKKTIEGYFFYVGSTTSDYEITAEFIINHIKETFKRGNDIAESLRTLEPYDTDQRRPTLKWSKQTDKEEKDRENTQFELQHKAHLEKAMEREHTYKDNQFKAYALLWERCAKAMQNRIRQRKDYKSKIYNQPIELLKAIK